MYSSLEIKRTKVEHIVVRRMKRALADSDCEDFGDDSLGSPSQSCQVQDRKRRRGVIEKRRRDRINTSLSELKRLVPSAFEKQGSAKLEKAEILQMTVDHLKMLNARGLNNPATFEMDYRNMGFRECCTEVARYLAAAEGLDIQNPLRLRLLSHLEAFGAQKELSLKAEISGYNWHRLSTSGYTSSQNAFYPTTNSHYHHSSVHHHQMGDTNINSNTSTALSAKLKDPSYGSAYSGTTPAAYYGQSMTASLHPHQYHHQQNGVNTSSSSSPTTAFSSASAATAAVTGLANLSPNTLYGSTNNYNDLYKSFRPW